MGHGCHDYGRPNGCVCKQGDRPDGPGDPGPCFDVSDVGHWVPKSKVYTGNRQAPLPPGTNPVAFVVGAMLEMNRDEQDAVAEIAAGVLRGRTLYEPLNALTNPKNWQAEAREESRDLATYLAFDIVRRMRRGESK